ncbi:A/G-specific adenine glycosylase [Thermithiobacillus plumbiphilus]|uniref:Adenine DNA glycosylase n=1 Tax=Thermithiobacillus plumbiphilus TaxID=1729899 RepID=A0ABU9D8W5_9PROT
MSAEPIAPALLAWYRENGRLDLPWRQTRDPYALWLAEIMLQQTQVKTVLPYYQRFLQRFPDFERLAAADIDEVLHLWTGLGYYARARNLHACAKVIVTEHGGRFPADPAVAMSLPGIGRSTAHAILASAYDQDWAILDGNVKRVLSRYHAFAGDPASSEGQRLLWSLAEAETPVNAAHDYNQAIQDLGATLCSRSKPSCALCPLQPGCQAYLQGLTAQLPRRPERRQMPVRLAWLSIIEDGQHRVLLQRQGPAGLWGGLWTLPQRARDELEGPSEAAQGFAADLGLHLQVAGALPAARHTFTHFHLDYIPLLMRSMGTKGIRDAKDLAWVSPADPGRRGLARPTERILHQLAGTGQPKLW